MSPGPHITVHQWLYLSIFVYVVGACYNLREPGANYDEMLYAAPAVNFVTGLENTEPMQINPSVIRILGRPFPVMVMTYIGSLKVAWHALFFAVFGVSVEIARLASVALGVLALLWTYGFVRRLLGQTTADVTSLLVGVSSEWVFYTSRDMTIVVMVLCKMAALYYGYRYWQEKKKLWVGLTGLFLGLGLYDKASFLWILMALAVYAVVFERTRIRRLSLQVWAILAATFTAGSLVFLVFNLVRWGASFDPVKSNLSSAGIQFSDLPQNFVVRVGQVASLMSGEAILELFTGAGYRSDVLSYGTLTLVWIAIMGGMMWPGKRKDHAAGRRLVFVAFMGLFPLTLTVYSPTVLSLHHVAVVWPFHWIFVAVAFQMLASRLAVRRIWLPVLVLMVIQVLATVTIYSRLAREGAVSNWSEAIYELNDDLIRRDEPVIAVSWGFTDNLLVTSRGRVKLVRLYRELIGAESSLQEERISRSLGDDRLYLVRLDQPPDDNELFSRVALRSNYELKVERDFREKSGRPIYRLYSAHWKSVDQF